MSHESRVWNFLEPLKGFLSVCSIHGCVVSGLTRGAGVDQLPPLKGQVISALRNFSFAVGEGGSCEESWLGMRSLVGTWLSTRLDV